VPIRDFAVYVGGQRLDQHVPFDETLAIARQHNGIAWMQLDHPDPEEVRELAEELGIHNLVVEDAINGHQRSKIEHYGDLLYVVLHPAVLDEATDRVYYGEIHVIVGPEYAITICRDEGPTSAAIVDKIDHDRTLVGHSSLALLHALFDAVVDGYQPIIARFENEVDEVEDQLFNRNGRVFHRIYDLLREVITLQRATHSILTIAQTLQDGTIFHSGSDDGSVSALLRDDDIELKHQWRDVLDHAIAISDRAEEYRQVLENALAVHSTLVSMDQNEEMRRMTQTSVELAEMTKKVSSWAAIIFAPTLIAGIYGMNFVHQPEFAWLLGYPFALGLMIAFAGLLYFLFKKANWL
jgi:magnesium transporter